MTATPLSGSEDALEGPLPYGLLRRLGPRPSSFRLNAHLARELTVTTFRLKYAGSVLGYIWSLMKPLLLFGMLYVVFGLFLFSQRHVSGTNFPVELLLGIIVWSFFNEATSTALMSIVINSDMVKKAYFPRWILVVAATLSSGMTLLVNLALFTAVALPLHWLTVSLSSLLFIPLLLEMYAITLGASLLVSALYVYYRDLIHIWEVVLQAFFFASVIIFPFTFLPPRFQPIAMFNPIGQIFEDMRRSLTSPGLPWVSQVLGHWYFAPPTVAALTLVVGVLVFRALSPRFGQRI